jgi:hypothetical protein
MASDDIPGLGWIGFHSLAGTDLLYVFDDEAELSGRTSLSPTMMAPAPEGTMPSVQEEPSKKEEPMSVKPAKEEDDDPLDDLSDAFQLLNHGHRDMIATSAFNYYGDRFATGSVDGKIKVYNKNNAGHWVLCDTWGAHNAEVYQVQLPSHPSTFDIAANIYRSNGSIPNCTLTSSPPLVQTAVSDSGSKIQPSRPTKGGASTRTPTSPSGNCAPRPAHPSSPSP